MSKRATLIARANTNFRLAPAACLPVREGRAFSPCAGNIKGSAVLDNGGVKSKGGTSVAFAATEEGHTARMAEVLRVPQRK